MDRFFLVLLGAILIIIMFFVCSFGLQELTKHFHWNRDVVFGILIVIAFILIVIRASID